MKQVMDVFFIALFLVLPAIAQEQIIFEDDFSYDKKKWLTVDDKNKRMSISMSKYIIEGRDRYEYSSTQSISINEKEDFTIEVTTSWLGGVNISGYGIRWGSYNNANIYHFGISAGDVGDVYTKYYIGRRFEGEWVYLVPWTASFAINKRSTNHLKIKKYGQKISFYINNL